MAQPLTVPPTPQYQPLISTGFLLRTALVISAFAIFTVILSLTGRWMGEKIARGGHGTSTDLRALFVGGEQLRFPANAIRFENQRAGGAFERIDLYMLFPEMQGYSNEASEHFNDIVASDKLLFLTIESATMPLDMAERLEPVYKRLVEPTGTPVPGGLTRYRFQQDTRYGDELLYVGQRRDLPPFVVRCLNPSDLPQGSRSCLRDFGFGTGLSATYRFSDRLLGKWRQLDAAVISYVTGALQVGN